MSKSLSRIFRLDDDLDMRVAFAAIGASIILLIVNFRTLNSLFNYEVLFTLLFASVVYLLIRRKAQSLSASLAPPENRPGTKANLYLLNILFFVLLAVSLVVLHQGLNTRPLAFLVIAAIMAGILAVEIALSRNQGSFIFILLQIFILGLLLRASAYYQFPGIVGNDPPYHINFIEQLLAQGKVGDFGDYSGFPGMHIFISSISLISGLSLRNSYFFIGIIECLSLVFVFLIGKAVINEKLGLLAALLLGITNQHILWGFYIVPMSFCLALMQMIIFLLFSRWKGIAWGILLILTSFTVVISHSISAAVLLCILAGTWIALFVIKLLSRGSGSAKVPTSRDVEIVAREGCPAGRANQQGKKLFPGASRLLNMPNLPLLGLTAIYFIMMVGYWWFASGNFHRILNNIYIAAAPTAITTPTVMTTPTQVMTTPATPIASPTLWVMPWWESLAVLSFVFFAMLGALHMFRLGDAKKDLRIQFVILSLLMTVLVVLLYNAFRGSLPERWIPFALVLLSIAAGVGLLLVCSAIGKKAILQTIFIFMTTLCMLMVINLEANVAPFISQSSFPRIAFTASEIKAAETISEITYSQTCPLYVDYYYSLVFKYGASLGGLEDIDILPTKAKWPVDGMILVLREEVRDNPFYTGRKILNKSGKEQYRLFVEVRENPFYNDRVISNKLDNALYQSFVEGVDYSLFYSCGSVKAMKYLGSPEK